jgi:hypothetical protein
MGGLVVSTHMREKQGWKKTLGVSKVVGRRLVPRKCLGAQGMA